jgi:hypothetical protein
MNATRRTLTPLLVILFSGVVHAQIPEGAKAAITDAAIEDRVPPYLRQVPITEEDSRSDIQESTNTYLKRTAKYRENATYSTTQRVVSDSDVSAVSLDPTVPLKGPCADSRPPGSHPDVAADAFYHQHPEAFRAVAAIVVWNQTLGMWNQIGSGGLVSPSSVVSAAHVYRAAFGLTQPDQNGAATTQHEGYLLFNVFLDKFKGPIPNSYDPKVDSDAVRVPAGSRVKLSQNNLIDVAVLSVTPQSSRPQVHVSSSVLVQGTPLAVIGIPGRPEGEDATDYRVLQDFATCGYDSDEWPVTMRVATGAYLGIESPTIDTIDFTISTIGGMSGGMILQQSDASLVAIVAGTKEAPIETSNVGFGSKALAEIIGP